MVEERCHDGSAQPLPLPRPCHTHFIDEHLRRLVGVNIMNARCETDNAAIDNGSRNVMPGICQKFFGQTGDNGGIEDIVGRICQQRRICRPQQANGAPRRHT